MIRKSVFLMLCALFVIVGKIHAEREKTVYVGVFLSDVSGFDISEGRFNADLIVWCKWLGDSAIPPLTYANGEIESMEMVDRESEGQWHSAKWRIQGTFRGTFPLQKFPFDKQSLKINIDIPQEWGIIYPDLSGSGMADVFSITGWEYEPYFRSGVKKVDYYSDFGSIANEGKPHRASEVSFILDINRPLMPYVLKYFLPLFIVLFMSIVGFFISPEEVEANLGLSVTALLTCVALHMSLGDSIPDVSYLLTVDVFFIFSYLLIFYNVVETVLSFRMHKLKPALAQKIESYSWKATTGAVIIGTIAMIIFGMWPKADIIETESEKESITVHESTKDELVVLAPALETLNRLNILKGLITRGLYIEYPNNKKVPHIIEKVPELTNDCVRFMKDGTVIVRWILKENAKWGDGSPITVDDLIFSFKMHENENLIDITTVDKKTVDIRYESRTRDIIDNRRIYPKKHFAAAFEANGYDSVAAIMAKNPPSMDGPYIFKEFEVNDHLILTRNEYYIGDKPRIKEIHFVKIAGKKPVDYFLAKEADLCGNLSVATTNSLLDIEHISIKRDRSESFYFLQPDHSVYPLNELEFRKAIAMAIDRERLVELLSGEGGMVAYTYRPEKGEDYNDKVLRYPYAPEKARRIFAKYPLKEPLKVICSHYVEMSPGFAVVEHIIKSLQFAGLSVELDVTKNSTLRMFKGANHGGLLYVNRTSRFPYPSYFFAEAAKTPEIQQLADKFSNTLFYERQVAISRRLQEIFALHLPVIPLAFDNYKSAVNKELRNWNPKAVPDNFWWNVEHLYFGDSKEVADTMDVSEVVEGNI